MLSTASSKVLVRAAARSRWPLQVVVIAAVFFMSATVSTRAGLLDDIQTFYANATFGWMDAAMNVARSIFLALIALEVVFTLVELLFRQRNLEDYLGALTFKLISIGVAVTLLTVAPTWIPAILSDFSRMGNYIGQGGGTVNALTPSGIIQIGQSICVTLWNTFLAIGNPVEKALFVIPVVFSMLMVLLGIGALAIQFLLTMIEAYIILGGTAFLLGFIGSRWTMSWAERYFGMVAVMGVKILVVSLLAAFAQQLGNEINAMIAAAQSANGGAIPVPDYLLIGSAGVIYGVIAWSAPAFVAKLMGTAPALQFRGVLSDVAGAGQTAGAGVAAVAGGVGGVVGAVAGASAGGAARNTIRSAAAVE